ncbi:MAG: transfer complex protein, partial [Halobacteriaceae archaeon]
SGKSFSSQLTFLRQLMRDDDVMLVMLDPLRGFEALNDALGGKRIVVAGDIGLNPLDIRQPPAAFLDRIDATVNPYTAKLQDVRAFFEMFYAIRGKRLDHLWGILERAVKEAYAAKDITADPGTHDNPSPTIQDVIDHLADVADRGEEASVSASREETRIRREHAAQLLIDFEPFQSGGELENLARPTEIDLTDETVVYLDLQQQEGRGATGLMMQLLFMAVYEQAKQSPRKMIFAIDESHYITKNATNLQFLEQAVRHSRHYDLSIQFITQTIDEFLEHPAAEAILQQTSIKQLHRIENLTDDLAGLLGLNQQQAAFVRNATPGNTDLGYSEALVQIGDQGWWPINVVANDLETRVLNAAME